MNLATAPDKAHRATRKGAATLHHNVNYELAYGTHHDRAHRERGERALDILEERFPGIADEAANITDPPELSAQASERLHSGDGRRRGTSKRSAPPPASPRRRTGTRGGTRRAAGRAFQFAGSAGSALAPGWGDLIGEILLAGIGLSIVYVLLTHPKGPSSLALGASNVVRALVSPAVDPLNPKGITK